MTHFTVQTLSIEARKVETTQFELVPSHEQAERVCGILREFLANRPAEFREKLAFLHRNNLELEWSASEGGAAFAALYSDGEPAMFALLASGKDPEADQGMYEGFTGSMVKPVLGDAQLPVADRPLLILVMAPGMPELAPLLQLLGTALASVYFRAVLAA